MVNLGTQDRGEWLRAPEYVYARVFESAVAASLPEPDKVPNAIPQQRQPSLLQRRDNQFAYILRMAVRVYLKYVTGGH